MSFGGGKRRSGATATLLKSVSLFFTNTQKRREEEAGMKAEQKVVIRRTEHRKHSHFSKAEVDSLCFVYQKLVENKETGWADTLPTGLHQPSASIQGKQGLDRHIFCDLLYNTFGIIAEDLILDRIFSTFDSCSYGVIRLDEWLAGMSVFLKGTLEEKTMFAFSVYDINGDGFIGKDEMFILLRNSLVKQPQDEDPEEGVKELVELVLKKLDDDKDGKISYTDFRSAVKKEPLFLEAFGQCLPNDPSAHAFLATLS